MGSAPNLVRLGSRVGHCAGNGIIDDGPDLTLLQLRPTEEELSAAGVFSQDNIELLGGPDVAPGVITLLRSTFEAVEDAEDPYGGDPWD